MTNELSRFRDIRTFILDVDGVLTNSELIVMETGDLLRKMNVRDGYAIKRAVRKGYNVCIITGGNSKGVEKRLQRLGVAHIYSGVDNKMRVFEDYLHEHNLDPAHILYMGDDMPDYKVMRQVALPCCPHDSAPDIIGICQYVSPLKGGQGCVRDVIEKVLRLHDNWIDDPRDVEFEIDIPE